MTATSGRIEQADTRPDGGDHARRSSRARVAIYARSSGSRPGDLVDQQIRRCRDHAVGEGWDVVGTFSDVALAGAARTRPALDALMADAASFDVVLVESTDRLARDLTAVAEIRDRLASHGVAIATVAEGDPDLIRANPAEASTGGEPA